MTLVIKGFAFGLTWYTSTSDSREELERQAKRLKTNVYAEAVHETSRMYGFAETKKWKGVRAAAAGVAEALPEGGLFIHRLDARGTSCLIAIGSERRLPLPGMDLHGAREQMIARAKDYIAAQSGQAVKVYGDVLPEEIEGAHELSFERVAGDAVIAGALKPVTQFDPRYALPFLIAMGMAAIWYGDELTGVVAPAQAAPVQSPDMVYRNQVTAAIDGVAQLNQFPSNVMDGFLPFLAEVPSEAAGWQFENLKCIDTECTAVWRRQPGASSEGLLRALRLDAADPSVTFYDVDFMKRKLSFRKGETARKLELMPNGSFSGIVGSWFQQLADREIERPMLGTPAPLVPPLSAAPGATPGAAPAAPQDTVVAPAVGQYRFSVPFNVQDLQAVAALPDALTIESIEVKREGRGRMIVQFNGKYYAI